MKKILTHLTGIVFVFSILVAGGCGNGKKQNSSENEENVPKMVADDSTTVSIFLKEEEIDGSMHLLMFDSKKPECEVIDNLITDVNPGDTVYWKKAQKSKIKDVKYIRPVKEDGKIFTEEATYDRDHIYHEYIIPGTAGPGTEKYEIGFTVQGYDTIFSIDPYLRIPDK